MYAIKMNLFFRNHKFYVFYLLRLNLKYVCALLYIYLQLLIFYLL
jgi:hypothetical protein